MSIYGFKIQDLVSAGRLTQLDLIGLRSWLLDEGETLPKFSDETLALLFLACENDFDAAKKCIFAYYSAKRDAPELFSGRNFNRDDLRQQFQILNFCIMPKRTDEGYVVMLHRLIDFDASKYQMDIGMKLLFMTMDSACYENPPTGLITIFDMNGVGIRHLMRVKLGAVKKFFYYLQEALPLQLRAVHVLNTVWFFDKVFTICRPFMKPEILQYLHLHTADLEMNEFYEKWIPKKCLPTDYGGELDSVANLQKDLEQKFHDLKHYFEQEELERTRI